MAYRPGMVVGADGVVGRDCGGGDGRDRGLEDSDPEICIGARLAWDQRDVMSGTGFASATARQIRKEFETPAGMNGVGETSGRRFAPDVRDCVDRARSFGREELPSRLQMRPKLFDGSSFLEFEKHFRLCWRLNQWSDREALNALLSSLHGDPLFEVQNLDIGLQTKVDAVLSHLRSVFCPVSELGAIVQLEKVAQSQFESVTALKHHILTLVTQAYPESDSQTREKHAVTAFLRAIEDSGVRRILIGENHRTFAKCCQRYHEIADCEATNRALSRSSEESNGMAVFAVDGSGRGSLKGGDLENRVAGLERRMTEVKDQLCNIAKSTDDRFALLLESLERSNKAAVERHDSLMAKVDQRGLADGRTPVPLRPPLVGGGYPLVDLSQGRRAPICFACAGPHLLRQCSVPRREWKCGNCGGFGHVSQGCRASEQDFRRDLS